MTVKQQKGVDQKSRDISGNTALGYSLAKCFWEPVKLLLNDDNIDEPIEWLRKPITPSQFEAKKRRMGRKKQPKAKLVCPLEEYEVCNDLAEYKRKLSIWNRQRLIKMEICMQKKGMTPLFCSISGGKDDLLETILSRRPDLVGLKKFVPADWSSNDLKKMNRAELLPFQYAAMHRNINAFETILRLPTIKQVCPLGTYISVQLLMNALTH